MPQDNKYIDHVVGGLESVLCSNAMNNVMPLVLLRSLLKLQSNRNLITSIFLSWNRDSFNYVITFSLCWLLLRNERQDNKSASSVSAVVIFSALINYRVFVITGKKHGKMNLA